jgi:uncharacterized iron-regulated protein
MLTTTTLAGQSHPTAYQLYSQKGKQTKYKKLVKAALQADIILFGETHNDPICHWLQNHLARDLGAAGPITIGMEMFESDQQAVLDQYMASTAELKDIDAVGEGLWGNFKTDYQPLVDWAKSEGIPVIATNTPRKYARIVFKEGFAGLDTLADTEQALLPPLPVPYDATLPGYVRMLEMMPGGHGGETFPMAQAIKDATMAHFIAANKAAGRRFLHVNGSYHSDDFEGISWYLQRYAPELKILTISTVEAADAGSGKGNFLLVTDGLMGKSY